MPNPFRMYELGEAYQRIAEQIDEGVPGAVEALATLEGDIEQKLTSTCRLLRSWEVTADNLKFEEARLAARRKSVERSIESTKAAIRMMMHAAGKRSVKGEEFTVFFVEGHDRVNVLSEEDLPDALVRVKREPDKKAILAALRLGPVDGAELIKGEEGLTVR